MSGLNLLDYTDYRSFLRDFYRTQKTASQTFSYRAFAMRAKLTSPNYLKLVIDGDRRITDKNLPNFIRGLKLGRLEAEYFRNLVFYQEADDPDAKTMHLREIMKLRARLSTNEITTIEKDRCEIIRSWHPWVIREMISMDDFRIEPEWISKRLRYKITPTEAAEALALLERLEFIRREGDRFVRSEPVITTQDDISTMLLKGLHRQFFEFAIQSLLNDPREEREISGVTMAVPKKLLPEIKTLVREFSREIGKRFSAESGNDAVYHLAIGLFPFSKEGEKT